MQKNLPVTILILIAVAIISGCKKDNLTEMLSGTYTVSGTEPNDSTSVPINNAVIQVQRKDKDRLTVSLFSLPKGGEFTLTQDDAVSSSHSHYFHSHQTNGVYTYNIGMAFYRNGTDSVYLSYFYQDSLPATEVYSYNLFGRKQ